MSIKTSIIGDSVNPIGVRLTSFILTYPRFIHAEFMTHRVFSRSAASSRAIPLRKMAEATKSNPAAPEYWGAEQRGMQAGGELNEYDKGLVKDVWEAAGNQASEFATALGHLGTHKQIANRLLEPFAHITVLATATDAGLSNFFALRAHPMAQPEFQVLAYRMLDQYMHSTPNKLEWGQWHVPQFRHAEYSGIGLGDDNDEGTPIEDRLKIATARCARLSYLTFDGEHSPAKDIELHNRLAESGHWSPFEHCAQAVTGHEYPKSNFDNVSISDGPQGIGIGGLSHWMQYRKQFFCENIASINQPEVMSRKPDWITL